MGTLFSRTSRIDCSINIGLWICFVKYFVPGIFREGGQRVGRGHYFGIDSYILYSDIVIL